MEICVLFLKLCCKEFRSYRTYRTYLLLRVLGRLNREVTGFELFFYKSEEAFGVGPIDHAMVEAKGKIGHPANADEVVAVWRGHHFGALFNLSNAQDGELWLVNDWCSE